MIEQAKNRIKFTFHIFALLLLFPFLQLQRDSTPDISKIIKMISPHDSIDRVYQCYKPKNRKFGDTSLNEFKKLQCISKHDYIVIQLMAYLHDLIEREDICIKSRIHRFVVFWLNLMKTVSDGFIYYFNKICKF